MNEDFGNPFFDDYFFTKTAYDKPTSTMPGVGWFQYGKDLYGKVEILPTPSGDILKKLFENNLSVGISSRAMGSVTQIGEGLVLVEDDLDIICWDFVSTPSNFGSYMRPEGKAGLKESISYEKEVDRYAKAHIMIRDLICSQSGICCIN